MRDRQQVRDHGSGNGQGLYATHTLVPPTPGPIAAAGNLGADLGLVILWGIVVSIPAMLAGYLYAITAGSRLEIEMPEGEDWNAMIQRHIRLPSPGQAFAAIVGALDLYLDFINIFLFLLRLFGRRR